MVGTNQAASSRDDFLRHLKDSGLSLSGDLPPADDGDALARQLVDAGRLTPFQAAALLGGRLAELRFGVYEVLDLLGRGAMGTVYKARHPRLKRLVAIKVLAPEVAAEGTFAQRFQREAETLAQLTHPNIVLAFDAGDSPAGPYLVMEFVQGRDLATEVQEGGPLSLAEGVDCVLQAARGLAYAHARDLVHRDVKPANLLRDAGGVVKVADLGLARLNRTRVADSESAITRAGGIVGTIDYMAPEQALDSSGIDARADIYSLGCTLYFLLTGRPMYAGNSLMGLLLQHREAPPPLLRGARPEAPESLEAVFRRMVAKKAEDRYPSMTEAIDALEAVAAEVRALGPEVATARPGVGVVSGEKTVDLGSARQSTDHESRPAAPPSPTVVRPVPSQTLVEAPRQPVAPAPDPTATVLLPRPAPEAAAVARPTRRLLLLAAVVPGLLALVAVALLGWWLATRGTPTPSGPGAGLTDGPPRTADGAPRGGDGGARPGDGSGRPAPFAGAVLSGGGSTAINPLMQHWARIYEKREKVRVDYQSVGSGRGRDGVVSRVYQFGCSDAFMTDKQLADARAVGGPVLHVPLVLGGVVPTYNLPGVGERLRFTGPILADIFLGKIKTWDDPALRIANPEADLPNLPILTVHRSDQSGTTAIWTDYLSRVSGEWKERVGSGTSVKWPVGVEGKGNDGVADLVSRSVGALGYLELSYALENNLKFGEVKNRSGRFSVPSLESVTAAADALPAIPDDLRFVLTDAPGEGSYPVVGVTYALIYADQTRNPSGRELVAFLRWATHQGQAYTKDVGYAPLAPELVQRIDGVLSTVRLKPE